MQYNKADQGLSAIVTNSLARRAIFSIAVVILAAPAIYRSYGIFRADRIVRSVQTLEGYSRALKYDPKNAVLWWNRGRLRHYSVGDVNITEAASDYQHALSLNPRLGQAWVDLSDCYDRTGRLQEAELALQKAFAAQRYSPLIRWQAGNFYLRRGNLPKMYECFKLACEYESEKLNIAMAIAWKVDPDHSGILQKLVPDNLPSDMKYLSFLVERDELDLAGPVWQRCLKNDIPTGYDFKPSSTFAYIDHLLAHTRIQEAMHVWDDILRKTRSGLSDTRLKELAAGSQDPKSGNMIWNGSFENEILRGGFDWRYPDSSEVRFRVDTGNRMDQLKSLRVTFGDANVSSGYLNQIVPVMKPGPYRLDFYLRTEALTTDQMPYLAIEGYPEASGAFARSAFFPAATSWSRVTIPFVVKGGCKAVLIHLRRDKSAKFDNQIKGSLWLDGFVMYSEANEKTAAPIPGP